jgi:hypothetical protein
VFGGKAGGREDLLHEDGSAQSFEVDLAGCDELAEVSAEPWKETKCAKSLSSSLHSDINIMK